MRDILAWLVFDFPAELWCELWGGHVWGNPDRPTDLKYCVKCDAVRKDLEKWK